MVGKGLISTVEVLIPVHELWELGIIWYMYMYTTTTSTSCLV